MCIPIVSFFFSSIKKINNKWNYWISLSFRERIGRIFRLGRNDIDPWAYPNFFVSVGPNQCFVIISFVVEIGGGEGQGTETRHVYLKWGTELKKGFRVPTPSTRVKTWSQYPGVMNPNWCGVPPKIVENGRCCVIKSFNENFEKKMLKILNSK